MAAIFRVFGPYKIPLSRGKKFNCIEPGCSEFWTQSETTRLAKERGCYLFAIRAAKGYRPIYVGKTSKSFERECFASHKIANHYLPALSNTGKGTPVMFLIILSRSKGVPNQRAIGQVESFLIQNALVKNPKLSNVQGTKEEHWGITGIIRGGKGKVSQPTREFRKAMGI
jgi:hypothetical protein